MIVEQEVIEMIAEQVVIEMIVEQEVIEMIVEQEVIGQEVTGILELIDSDLAKTEGYIKQLVVVVFDIFVVFDEIKQNQTNFVIESVGRVVQEQKAVDSLMV